MARSSIASRQCWIGSLPLRRRMPIRQRCGVEPFAWFRDVLSRIPAHSITRLSECFRTTGNQRPPRLKLKQSPTSHVQDHSGCGSRDAYSEFVWPKQIRHAKSVGERSANIRRNIARRRTRCGRSFHSFTRLDDHLDEHAASGSATTAAVAAYKRIPPVLVVRDAAHASDQKRFKIIGKVPLESRRDSLNGPFTVQSASAVSAPTAASSSTRTSRLIRRFRFDRTGPDKDLALRVALRFRFSARSGDHPYAASTAPKQPPIRSHQEFIGVGFGMTPTN